MGPESSLQGCQHSLWRCKFSHHAPKDWLSIEEMTLKRVQTLFGGCLCCYSGLTKNAWPNRRPFQHDSGNGSAWRVLQRIPIAVTKLHRLWRSRSLPRAYFNSLDVQGLETEVCIRDSSVQCMTVSSWAPSNFLQNRDRASVEACNSKKGISLARPPTLSKRSAGARGSLFGTLFQWMPPPQHPSKLLPALGLGSTGRFHSAADPEHLANITSAMAWRPRSYWCTKTRTGKPCGRSRSQLLLRPFRQGPLLINGGNHSASAIFVMWKGARSAGGNSSYSGSTFLKLKWAKTNRPCFFHWKKGRIAQATKRLLTAKSLSRPVGL